MAKHGKDHNNATRMANYRQQIGAPSRSTDFSLLRTGGAWAKSYNEMAALQWGLFLLTLQVVINPVSAQRQSSQDQAVHDLTDDGHAASGANPDALSNLGHTDLVEAGIAEASTANAHLDTTPIAQAYWYTSLQTTQPPVSSPPAPRIEALQNTPSTVAEQSFPLVRQHTIRSIEDGIYWVDKILEQEPHRIIELEIMEKVIQRAINDDNHHALRGMRSFMNVDAENLLQKHVLMFTYRNKPNYHTTVALLQATDNQLRWPEQALDKSLLSLIQPGLENFSNWFEIDRAPGDDLLTKADKPLFYDLLTKLLAKGAKPTFVDPSKNERCALYLAATSKTADYQLGMQLLKAHHPSDSTATVINESFLGLVNSWQKYSTQERANRPFFYDFVDRFLEKGAAVNYADPSTPHTVLYLAATSDNRLLDLLRQHGVNLDQQSAVYGTTTLLEVVATGDIASAERLIADDSVDVNRSCQVTPAGNVRLRGLVELQKHSNPSITDQLDQLSVDDPNITPAPLTPLEFAAMLDDEQMVRVLIAKCGHPDSLFKSLNTALNANAKKTARVFYESILEQDGQIAIGQIDVTNQGKLLVFLCEDHKLDETMLNNFFAGKGDNALYFYDKQGNYHKDQAPVLESLDFWSDYHKRVRSYRKIYLLSLATTLIEKLIEQNNDDLVKIIVTQHKNAPSFFLEMQRNIEHYVTRNEIHIVKYFEVLIRGNYLNHHNIGSYMPKLLLECIQEDRIEMALFLLDCGVSPIVPYDRSKDIDHAEAVARSYMWRNHRSRFLFWYDRRDIDHTALKEAVARGYTDLVWKLVHAYLVTGTDITIETGLGLIEYARARGIVAGIAFSMFSVDVPMRIIRTVVPAMLTAIAVFALMVYCNPPTKPRQRIAIVAQQLMTAMFIDNRNVFINRLQPYLDRIEDQAFQCPIRHAFIFPDAIILPDGRTYSGSGQLIAWISQHPLPFNTKIRAKAKDLRINVNYLYCAMDRLKQEISNDKTLGPEERQTLLANVDKILSPQLRQLIQTNIVRDEDLEAGIPAYFKDPETGELMTTPCVGPDGISRQMPLPSNNSCFEAPSPDDPNSNCTYYRNYALEHIIEDPNLWPVSSADNEPERGQSAAII